MELPYALLIMLSSYNEANNAFEAANKKLNAGAYFRTYIAEKIKEGVYDEDTRICFEDLCSTHTIDKDLSKAIFSLNK
jgi:hypothetical protein